jgi:hypothetical protein
MLLVTLLFGIGAAVIRGFQLTKSFDPETALIAPGDPFTIFLMVLSAVFVLLAAAGLWRRKRAGGFDEIEDRPVGSVWLAVQSVALALLCSASVLEFLRGISDADWGSFFTKDSNIQWSLVCLGLLGVFSTAALFMTALNINKRPEGSAAGFWATVPVFWSCLMLVTDFWGQAGIPVRNTYVYGMLGAVFCTIALYTVAGFFFGRAKPANALFYSFSGIYFSALTLGGFAVSLLLYECVKDCEECLCSPMYALSVPVMLRFGFIILHLSALSAAVLRGKFTPAAEDPEEEPFSQ